MTVDLHRIVLTGENPFIRLNVLEDGPVSINASYLHILFYPPGRAMSST